MGKTTRFLAEGQDFDFSRGTANAMNSPRNHPTMGGDEFGDGTFLARESAVPTYARGGKAKPPAAKDADGPALPGGKKMPKAGKAIMGALALGKAIGQATGGAPKGALPGAGPVLGGGPPGGGLPPAGLPRPGAGVMPGAPPVGMPAMKKGGRAKKMADGGSAKLDIGEGALKPMATEAKNLTPNPVGSGRKQFIKSHNPGQDQYWEDKAQAEEDAETSSRRFDDDQRPRAGHAKGGHFIQSAIKKPGQLHKDLGVPQGQKIPAAKLEAAAGKPGKIGQRARFAETLKGMHKKG